MYGTQIISRARPPQRPFQDPLHKLLHPTSPEFSPKGNQCLVDGPSSYLIPHFPRSSTPEELDIDLPPVTGLHPVVQRARLLSSTRHLHPHLQSYLVLQVEQEKHYPLTGHHSPTHHVPKFHSISMPPTQPQASENECYAVICTASEIGPSEEMIKDNVKNALEERVLTIN